MPKSSWTRLPRGADLPEGHCWGLRAGTGERCPRAAALATEGRWWPPGQHLGFPAASSSDHSSAPIQSLHLPPCAAMSSLHALQQPGDKAARRPNGSETAVGLLLQVVWSYFVPGKPPYTPNSAILRLSRAVKTLVVFLTDSLARRLSLALFLTLTIGHPKGISAGCSVGSVGH